MLDRDAMDSSFGGAFANPNLLGRTTFCSIDVNTNKNNRSSTNSICDL
jgi:hypothetical protein